MALIGAKDSRIILNGAELTSSKTTVNANGLEIKLTSKTKEGETVNFSVDNDVDAVYENIKKALKEYNDVMSEMKTLYNAESSKGYEPLTKEQKEAMSDDEVEEWEKKIKDSLLRNDSTLSGIMSSMRTAMMSNVTVDGKSYSLSSFGIMTSTDYTEGGLLHIYGDEDDSVYSAQPDKLKAALKDDPDATVKALSDIFENLRKTMYTKMSAVPNYSSSLSFYSDVKYKNDLKSYEQDIKDWEDKLATMEDAYYKKFTAMETAMAKIQSQTNSIAGLFGG
jgi:flagellar hook-associated protein 2